MTSTQVFNDLLGQYKQEAESRRSCDSLLSHFLPWNRGISTMWMGFKEGLGVEKY